ncbi:MAG: TIGR00730 family Rossman fold protein [Candidatus Limnocylindrales bacterium]
MRAVAVFCGSLPGRDPVFLERARSLGALLAERGITLVYGGGRVGLMGAVADGALGGGGRVVGVIPRGLVDRELAHRGLADIRVTTSMHERKATMADLSDAFIALPGGAGTLDELFEAWTWTMLGIHTKPCALLDVAGFYAGLRQHVEHMVRSGFIESVQVAGLLVDDDAGRLLDRLAAWQAPAPKWADGPPP